jgi:hypothetical protein
MLLMIWISLAMLSGVIAWRKGRSIALWTALGFGSGVLALGVISMLPGPHGHSQNWGVSALMRAAERLADHTA